MPRVRGDALDLMRRRIVPVALVALAVPDLGCDVHIFNWKTQEENSTDSESETSATDDPTGTSTGGPESSGTETSTSGLTGSDTQAETTTVSTETGTLTDTTTTTTTSTETMEMTTGSPCGNDVCDPGESYADCPADCPADCGNGMQEGDEACDDGNTDDTDECVQGCKTAACGDGFVQVGVEECDDQNQVDTDACRNTCKLPRRLVFVTKAAFPGNMGVVTGLAGADAQCAVSATAAGLVGPFKAWLSDSNETPLTRFVASLNGFTGVYELVDGTKVADGWVDLTDGDLDHPIDMTEDMTGMVDVVVWSNTSVDGNLLFANKHCENWASGLGSKQGATGLTVPVMSDMEWTEYIASGCSSMNSLYCFEDHP